MQVVRWLLCIVLSVVLVALFVYGLAQLKSCFWEEEPVRDLTDSHIARPASDNQGL